MPMPLDNHDVNVNSYIGGLARLCYGPMLSQYKKGCVANGCRFVGNRSKKQPHAFGSLRLLSGQQIEAWPCKRHHSVNFLMPNLSLVPPLGRIGTVKVGREIKHPVIARLLARDEIRREQRDYP